MAQNLILGVHGIPSGFSLIGSMVYQFTRTHRRYNFNGTRQNPLTAHDPTRLRNRSAEYLAKRKALRLVEIESMKLREQVAQLRRELPQGATVENYAFIEGPVDLNSGDTPTRTVRLSELFTAPDRALVLYQFMYGKRQTSPCPMCTLLIDSLNGAAHHLAQNVDLAIVAAADTPALRAHGRRQQWNDLRLLSTPEGSTFKYDMGGEDREGNQDSTVSVFNRAS